MRQNFSIRLRILLLNYGRATPVVTVLSHVVYGAIIGAFVAAGGR